MFLYLKKTKSVILMLLVFFSCASNPEYNYRLAKKSIEIVESKNCASKELNNSKYYYEMGLMHYKQDKWNQANDFFKKAIEKAEYAEENNILCN